MNLRTRQYGFALALGLAAAALAPSRGGAQGGGADVREIKPVVMLLVDTSGSMERRADCICPASQPDCTSCLPKCGEGTYERNRWATLLEALTGSWSDFSCSQAPRPTGAPDANYFIPHYTNPGAVGQALDGILDSYASRFKFGLMTFDNVGTLTTQPALVYSSDFMAPAFLARSQGVEGDYSYGIPQSFWFPNCTSWHTIDNGAHSTMAEHAGPLISVGDEQVSTPESINAQIQSALFEVRPYGATPIAGMLTDLQHYLQTDPDVMKRATNSTVGDPYADCRKRFAVLITDGYPNADMRGAPVNCDGTQNTTPDPPYPPDRADIKNLCPYELPEDIAAELCHPIGGECSRASGGLLDGLYVIGFAFESAANGGSADFLNAVAASGGTGTALSASNLASLRAALSSALDTASSTATTRTVPAFAQPSAGGISNSAAQFQTGFLVRNAPGQAWSGILERRRIECDASTHAPVQQSVSDADRFQLTLNQQSTRTIYTVVPTAPAAVTGYLRAFQEGGSNSPSGITSLNHTVTTAGTNGTVGRGNGGDSCTAGGRLNTTAPLGGDKAPPDKAAQANLALRTFDASIDPSYFGLSDDDDRTALVNWVRADGVRAGNRLGDIYHSSPTLVGPPTVPTSDESYNAFMQRPEVANRPTVIYVGTNDGMIHAFVARDTTITSGPHNGTTLSAGTELWAFVPPAVFPLLNATRTGHVFTVDGAPLVKDVYFRRAQGTQIDASIYHTVLLAGLGLGGGAYYALDVTDPIEPKFLWQFATPDMGNTLGAPAMGQVLVSSANDTFVETGLAILPGGTGVDQTSTCSDGLVLDPAFNLAQGCPPQGVGMPQAVNGNTYAARSHERCWTTRGRQLYFLDIATGEVMQHLNDRVFNAPVSGGISLYTGDVGTIATRAFFTDHDGVLWRINLAASDPANWTAAPVYDLFGGLAGLAGQPALYPPLVTTDGNGKVVVIQGTGDIDNLESTSAKNRVASLTEDVAYNADGSVNSMSFSENWVQTLPAGQQLTGPLDLFNGQVFYSTFSPTANVANQCDVGESYICGFDYRASETTGTSRSPVSVLSPTSTNVNNCLGPYPQQIIMGTKVVAEPSCYDTQSASVTDPYVGTRTVNSFVGRAQPTFKLVAQISGTNTQSPDGAQVSQFSQTLAPPVSYTQVSSWAGRAD